MKKIKANDPAEKIVINRLWNRNFILVCLSAFFSIFVFHSLISILPIYILKFNDSKKIIGLAMAFLTVAAVISRPIAGLCLDHFNRKIILLIGTLIFLFPTFFFIFMVPIGLLLFFRFIQGLGWGISSTSQGTIASDFIPGNRLGEGIGIFSLTSGISLAISPVISLWTIDTFSFKTLFIICSMLIMLSLFFTLLIKYPRVKTDKKRIDFSFIGREALPPAIVILFITLTYSSIISFLAVFVRLKGMTTAGLFFSSFAISSLLARPLSGKIIDAKGDKGYDFIVLAGSVSIIISLLIIANVSIFYQLILSGVFFGIGFGFLQPGLFTLCISTLPVSKRGIGNATYWTAFDIGVAIGSVLWGFVSNYFGYTVMFYINNIPPIMALVFYFYWRIRIKNNNKNLKE